MALWLIGVDMRHGDAGLEIKRLGLAGSLGHFEGTRLALVSGLAVPVQCHALNSLLAGAE
jgi:hypothetical protein